MLPARVPHLLVNGAAGIAVGIATKIPPHNLREVVAGLKALIHDPNITIAQLMQHIPGPDFPTGTLTAVILYIPTGTAHNLVCTLSSQSGVLADDATCLVAATKHTCSVDIMPPWPDQVLRQTCPAAHCLMYGQAPVTALNGEVLDWCMLPLI